MTIFSTRFKILGLEIRVEDFAHGNLSNVSVSINGKRVEESTGDSIWADFPNYLKGAARVAAEEKVLRNYGESVLQRILVDFFNS